MNKNTIIGLVLIVAIFVGYNLITSPSKQEREEMQRKQDSLARIQKQKTDSITKVTEATKKRNDSINNINKEFLAHVKDSTKNNSDSIQLAFQKQKWGNFANSVVGKEKHYILETDFLKIDFTNKGGRIYSVELKKFKTYNQKPLILFSGDSSKFGLNFFDNNKNISTKHLIFKPFVNGSVLNESQSHITIPKNDSLKFTMRLSPTEAIGNNDKYIDFVYTIYGNSYMQSFDVEFKGMDATLNENTNLVDLEWQHYMLKQERSLKNERNLSTIYYKYWDDDVDYITETKDDTEDLKTKIQWISFKQSFFASTLISKKGFKNAKIETQTPDSDSLLKSAYTNITCEVQDATKIPMQMYFGPLKYKTLSNFHIDLERQIPLGWSFFLMQWINRFAVLPVFNFLEGFNLNYGIIILILTILLKIVLFPIAYRTYKSSAKMRVLKPEIEEIAKKFPKKEDALKKQQATMSLYKKAGASPMSGCVPMLLQFPILIAMFRFFPASIELRQKSFLWADDLSSYDAIITWEGNIPLISSFYGNHVSLFTLLMTISTIIYTRVNNQMMSSNQQMPGMKTMMYIMPIMFLFIFNSYSSGLSYYYFLANIITFAQMFFIRRFINEDKLKATIEANKKKPTKKSSFQKRLEEMQKQRTQQGKKRR